MFGLPAFWILDRTVLDAQAKGFTVVDAPTVLTTHLVELMSAYGHELYDGAQLDTALERVQSTHPKLVDDLIPDPLPRPAVLKVFRNLLKEGLSVRDTQTILEALADFAPRSRDPDILTEFTRQRMARHITGRFANNGVVRIVQLGPGRRTRCCGACSPPRGAPRRCSCPPSTPASSSWGSATRWSGTAARARPWCCARRWPGAPATAAGARPAPGHRAVQR